MNISDEDKVFILEKVKEAETALNNDDIDSLLDLLDKYIAIYGFDEKYDLTDDGRTAQRIYDRVYFNN